MPLENPSITARVCIQPKVWVVSPLAVKVIAILPLPWRHGPQEHLLLVDKRTRDHCDVVCCCAMCFCRDAKALRRKRQETRNRSLEPSLKFGGKILVGFLGVTVFKLRNIEQRGHRWQQQGVSFLALDVRRRPEGRGGDTRDGTCTALRGPLLVTTVSESDVWPEETSPECLC